MEYFVTKPSVQLSKFVKQYWTIESCVADNQIHTQRIVPNGLQELAFYLGDRPISTDTAKSISENAIITGHLREFYDLNISGKLSVFSITFKPQGLSMFFNVPLNEIYNKNVPFKYLFKYDTVGLEHKLFEANSFIERIIIIENFLLGILARSANKYDYDRIEHSIGVINRTRGLVNVDFLASQTCLSRKQFERIFSQYVGTTPKQFLKTIRFQNTLDIKSKNKSSNLTDLTYRCGYFDQSHMIKDFQKLAGMTPKQYFNECEPYSDYFQ